MSIAAEDAISLVRTKLGGRAATMELTVDSKFRDIGLSSLQIADIVFTIEDRIGAEFDSAKAADLTTIGDLVELARATAVTTGG